MRLLKFVGGSVAMLYIVCAILAVLSFPSSADVKQSPEAAKVVEVKKDADASNESIVSNAADAIPDWLEILSTIIAVAGAITAVTPTPKDNVVLGVVRKVLDIFALNFGGAKNASADKTNRLR
jgi:hypothetical protein